MKLYCNHVLIGGNLGANAETKYTPAGTARTTFSVATTRKWKDQQGQQQEATTWHNIVMWDGAEWLAEALTKGAAVLVQGRIETRKYIDHQSGQERWITEIIADKYMGVQVLRDNPQGQQPAPRQQQPVSAPKYAREPAQQPPQQHSREYSDQNLPPSGVVDHYAAADEPDDDDVPF